MGLRWSSEECPPGGDCRAVDVTGNGVCSLLSGEEHGSPDEFGFQGLKEGLDHGVVVAVPPFPYIEMQMPLRRSSAR
jgi:hypothetical protein